MVSAPETVVMVTQRQRGPQISTDGSSHTKVIGSHPEHKFTHCGGSKHTRTGCYELIGYLDWWDHSETPCNNRSKSLNISSNSYPVSPAVSTTSAPASTSVATTGTQGYVLYSSSKKHTWIIDTGATDHMTFDPGQIASHTPSSQSVLSNANGIPSPIIGEGSLSLFDSLNLDSVLIVPSLHHNLLLVAQITMALNCIVTFWPTYCVFRTFSIARRLVVVLEGANSTTWTWHLTVKLASIKLKKLGVLVLRSKLLKCGYGIDVLDMLHLDIYRSYFHPYSLV